MRQERDIKRRHGELGRERGERRGRLEDKKEPEKRGNETREGGRLRDKMRLGERGETREGAKSYPNHFI